MDGIIVTPLKQIFHPKGDIFHAMKKSDIGFSGSGEAYFSTIKKNEIKGWKKHTKMYSYLTLYPLPKPEIKHNFYTLSHKVVSYIEEPYEGNLQVQFCEGHYVPSKY